jgi:hypothetical protein
MAKAKDLAVLAGLAGLGYMMSKKGDKKEADTGGDSNPTRAARPESTETREEPRRQITDYMKKAPLDGTEMYPSGVMGGARMADAVKPTPVNPRNVVTGNDLPPATTPMANAADRTDQLAGLSRAVNREAKTSKAAQGDFKGVTRNMVYDDGKTAVKNQEMYDTMTEKSGAGTSSARKTDALAVASRAARAADAKRRAAKQSAYKKGGMTSTASSASKRADGIATKGKTRGKIC